MAFARIVDLLRNGLTVAQNIDHDVTVRGWVRTKREGKGIAFLELNDGSSLQGLQIVVPQTLSDYDSIIKQITTGTSLEITGNLVESEGKGQSVEMQATAIAIFGIADPETYPLQKKRHSIEFLRTIAHLRPRTNMFGAVFRVRNACAFAVHKFFQERGFLWVHTPIVTASDCEGAGEMFGVTTFDLNKIAAAGKPVDYSQDFFGKPAFLTVSGQLEAEIMAMAFSNVYTFGPTFRAENSNTSRHLAEFWMIEPEVAFCDLEGDAEYRARVALYEGNVAGDDLEKQAAARRREAKNVKTQSYFKAAGTILGAAGGIAGRYGGSGPKGGG